jgi:hypothetical protein
MSIFPIKPGPFLQWEKGQQRTVSHKTLDMDSNFDKIHVLPLFHITCDFDFSKYIPFIMHLDICYV